MQALFRETPRYEHDFPPPVRQTAGQQNLGTLIQLRGVTRRRIAHQHGQRQFTGPLSQHIRQFLAGVLTPGEVDRDLPVPNHGSHTRGEHTGALVLRRARQFHNPHAGIVAVHHFALRGLPDQFIPRRLEQIRHLLRDLPLRRRRQWHPQALLHLLQPVERHPRAILQFRDHRSRHLVVLFRSHLLWLRSREHRATTPAPQALQLVDHGLLAAALARSPAPTAPERRLADTLSPSDTLGTDRHAATRDALQGPAWRSHIRLLADAHGRDACPCLGGHHLVHRPPATHFHWPSPWLPPQPPAPLPSFPCSRTRCPAAAATDSESWPCPIPVRSDNSASPPLPSACGNRLRPGVGGVLRPPTGVTLPDGCRAA